MKNTNSLRLGLTAGFFLLVLYFVCLSRPLYVTSPEIVVLHEQLLALTFPGFTWLTLGSFLWGALLSFIYGFLGGYVFGLIRNLFCSETKSDIKSCCHS